MARLVILGAPPNPGPQPVLKIKVSLEESFFEELFLNDWIKVMDALAIFFLILSVQKIACGYLEHSIEAPQLTILTINTIEIFLERELSLG